MLISVSVGAKDYEASEEQPCFSYKANLKKQDSTVCRPDGEFHIFFHLLLCTCIQAAFGAGD